MQLSSRAGIFRFLSGLPAKPGLADIEDGKPASSDAAGSFRFGGFWYWCGVDVAELSRCCGGEWLSC